MQQNNICVGEKLGRFVNLDNSAFQVALKAEIYVDKSDLIEYTNKVLNTDRADGLSISKSKTFKEHLNKYGVVHFDVKWCFMDAVAEPAKFIQLAYLTGILPIKKLKTQSALNNFTQFTMLNPGPMASCVGFTGEEVRNLCEMYRKEFLGVKTLV